MGDTIALKLRRGARRDCYNAKHFTCCDFETVPFDGVKR